MADSAEQVLHEFQAALKSGDKAALEKLISGSLTHNFDRQGMKFSSESAAAAGGPKNPAEANVQFLETITTGDTIVARFSFMVRGADVPGADPSKTATVNAIAIAKTEDGKVVSVNIEPDTASLYLQLGLGVADAKASK